MTSARSTVRVGIVDDSPLFVQAIRMALVDADEGITVVGVASDGRQAIDMAVDLEPDVLTMDVQMPVMDGIAAIGAIMSERPTPILVLTGAPDAHGGPLTLRALRAGAVDLWPKPSALPPSKEEAVALARRVRLVAGVAVVSRSVSTRPPAPTRVVESPPHQRIRAIGIVASTGGPRVLETVVRGLPPGLDAAVLIVQHLPAGFARHLADGLARDSALPVVLAEEGARLVPGTITIAPDGAHLCVDRSGRLTRDDGALVCESRPSGTVLLRSLASAMGSAAAGVVLSGLGRDGVDGLRAIDEAGGMAVVQDPASAAASAMPRAALAAVPGAIAVGVNELAPTLARMTQQVRP